MADETDEHRVTPAELQDISSRLKVRRNVGIVFGLVFVIVLVLFFITATSVLSSNSRQDCKTQYNAILTKPVTIRDNLAAQVTSLSSELQSELGSALLTVEAGGHVSSGLVQQYTATRTQLDIRRAQLAAAITKVAHLPTIDTASKRGFTFDRAHYPACPTA